MVRAGQLPGAPEDRVQHPGCQDAGEGVLLGDVVAAEERNAAGLVFGTVPELRLRPHLVETQGGVPGEGSETEDHPRVWEQLKFASSVGEAIVALGGCGLVLWRGATDGGGDPGSREPEAVVTAPGDRLVREAHPVEGGEEEVAGTVAGEDAARTVRAVGRRGEPEDYYLRLRVSEAGYGTAPVNLILIGGLLLAGDRLAPLDQPRTAAAGDDLPLQIG